MHNKPLWISAVAGLTLLGCMSSDAIGDPIDDCALCAGKADAHGVEDGSYVGEAIRQLSNSASLEILDHDVRLDSRAAAGIVAARPFEDLGALDSASYVGVRAFRRLATYVRERDLVGACGDAVLQERLEACDDGNLLDGDGCDARCELGDVAPVATAFVPATDLSSRFAEAGREYLPWMSLRKFEARTLVPWRDLAFVEDDVVTIQEIDALTSDPLFGALSRSQQTALERVFPQFEVPSEEFDVSVDGPLPALDYTDVSTSPGALVVPNVPISEIPGSEMRALAGRLQSAAATNQDGDSRTVQLADVDQARGPLAALYDRATLNAIEALRATLMTFATSGRAVLDVGELIERDEPVVERGDYQVDVRTERFVNAGWRRGQALPHAELVALRGLLVHVEGDYEYGEIEQVAFAPDGTGAGVSTPSREGAPELPSGSVLLTTDGAHLLIEVTELQRIDGVGFARVPVHRLMLHLSTDGSAQREVRSLPLGHHLEAADGTTWDAPALQRVRREFGRTERARVLPGRYPSPDDSTEPFSLLAYAEYRIEIETRDCGTAVLTLPRSSPSAWTPYAGPIQVRRGDDQCGRLWEANVTTDQRAAGSVLEGFLPSRSVMMIELTEPDGAEHPFYFDDRDESDAR